MRRALPAVLLLMAFPAAAAAHPLGNFTINHESAVSISRDRVDVAYVLDQAEIPTFQERSLTPAEVLARKRAEVARGLRLTVDGRGAKLALAPGGRVSFPAGQGGLRTTRVELALSAHVAAPRRVELRDETFPGRIGWKSVIVRPGDGTAVKSSVPAGDPTDGLRRYPTALVSDPLDQRSGTFSVAPGDGTVTAPDARRAQGGSGGDGFAALFADAASGKGVLVLLLLAALGWGALHALSPGHGKAMVAAYLVGTRGTARHAVALGATVTIAHTAGVFALGAVTLALSEYVLPEDLYPWLTLTAGLLVLVVGVGVLRARMRERRRHHHDHHHHDLSWRGLVAMGASAGLIPCPSALVVLLAAVAQHQVALGLLLITAFSLGLAATMTAVGIAVIHASRFTARFRFSGQYVSLVSALAIVGVGCVLTANALTGVIG